MNLFYPHYFCDNSNATITSADYFVEWKLSLDSTLIKQMNQQRVCQHTCLVMKHQHNSFIPVGQLALMINGNTKKHISSALVTEKTEKNPFYSVAPSCKNSYSRCRQFSVFSSFVLNNHVSQLGVFISLSYIIICIKVNWFIFFN